MLQTEFSYRKDKKVIWNSQHRIIKGKLCLNNLIAFCDEMTCPRVKGETLNVVYFDSSKAFDTVSHYLLTAKLVRYGLYKWVITCRKLAGPLCSKSCNQQHEAELVTGCTSSIPQGFIV